ncbi:MAG: 4-hydroxy-tetrahydrodipicolinate reductase [Deltaproteobacteria bacterium]|nr:4-hydroxy-tetrahydrodipicolinate reductase [Deltaproteobacteria bacterium]MBW2044968.1 4-hydroxy-tetrahydrodipicolinate reductase [Deltaproteobacteria bacterium]MBW2298768.1 4-hydroxy-tetrahydrodipicolinate reductase [Deltaproteobacteria bacterium]
MTKVIVAGAAGRMGGRIINAIIRSRDFELTGAFERPDHQSVGQDAGEVAGSGRLGMKISGSVRDVIDSGEVLIDFTTPEATLQNMKEAASHGLAMVIGTTGISADLLREVQDIAKTIRCVMSPNMSVGVNVMFKIAGDMAKLLGNDYDMEILEVHHRLKKDAPSGTAMRLAQILASSTNRNLEEVAVYQRKGIIGERTDKEIGIQTWRAGDITGEHTIMFGGIGERLELIHRAHNRDNFARGALKAAAWIIDQPPGLYDMQDVLGLK